MPVVSQDTLWRSPNLVYVPAQRYTIGWQDARKEGHCFVVARTSVMGEKILERFPLTEHGWVRAWSALVRLDPGAAEAVAGALEKMQAANATQTAEVERQAQVHEAFASVGPPTVLRSLGVQVLARVGEVYTIGDEIRGRNTSRLLGPLAGAQAVVTDGSQAWSPGRAMFLPLSLTGLATKTKADAVVIFADGTFHSVALDGNNAVREAQKQAVQFNALAGALAPDAGERGSDPAAKLRKLQELRDAGLLTQDEYEMKRAEVIDSI
jgi:Short C-terminal domain